LHKVLRVVDFAKVLGVVDFAKVHGVVDFGKVEGGVVQTFVEITKIEVVEITEEEEVDIPNVEKVKNWPFPQHLQRLRQLLAGCCGYLLTAAAVAVVGLAAKQTRLLRTAAVVGCTAGRTADSTDGRRCNRALGAKSHQMEPEQMLDSRRGLGQKDQPS